MEIKTKKTTINEKGITLIALVITIIVMLILVVVTINIAVNGGLFNYAGNASRKMYNNTTKYGVKSTLCYGVQWDAMIYFMDKTYEKDNTEWGNYKSAGPFDFNGKYYSFTLNEAGTSLIEESWKDNKTRKEINEEMILQTGVTDRNSWKNIYDAAGNISEWTMETYNNSDRVIRGGAYFAPGTFSILSISTTSIQGKHTNMGFRTALYVL